MALLTFGASMDERPGIPERPEHLLQVDLPTTQLPKRTQKRQQYWPFMQSFSERLAIIRVDNWHNVYQTELIIEPMEVAMQVGDILRKKASRVATVRMNETVAIAAQLMRSSNISALVVKDVVRTEGNTAVGMFTERDLVRAIAEHGAAGVNMKVSQLISVQQLVSCTSTDTLEHARHLMNRNHIRHLPVIDNYSLIGVVSIRDISTAFDEEATPFKMPA
jgi:CBS domain-containing protein